MHVQPHLSHHLTIAMILMRTPVSKNDQHSDSNASSVVSVLATAASGAQDLTSSQAPGDKEKQDSTSSLYSSIMALHTSLTTTEMVLRGTLQANFIEAYLCPWARWRSQRKLQARFKWLRVTHMSLGYPWTHCVAAHHP